MRQLKNEGSNAWSVKKLSKKISLLHKFGQKGFSLIELMVTMAIGVLVSLAIATVFIFGMEQMTLLIEKNHAEENSLLITFYLQRYLSQAVNVQAVTAINTGDTITINANRNTPNCPPPVAPNPPYTTNSLNCGYGQLDYDFDAHNMGVTGTGQYYRFAVFNREAGDPNIAGAVGSRILPTGVFVREPLNAASDPSLRSYGIYFNAAGTNTVPSVNLIPTSGNVFYDRIHNVRTQSCVNSTGAAGRAVEVVVDSAGPTNGNLIECLTPGDFAALGAGDKLWVKTITLEISTRYFKGISRQSWDYRWQDGDGPLPAGMPAYRDIFSTVKINLKNNTLTSQSLTGGPSQEQRVQGSLYFYNIYVPMSCAVAGNC